MGFTELLPLPSLWIRQLRVVVWGWFRLLNYLLDFCPKILVLHLPLHSCFSLLLDKTHTVSY